jgi:apolipoprotein D and lipocalin family protein
MLPYPGWLERLCSRTGIPSGVRPVRGFDAAKYLGKWNEIARLEQSFERGLSRCTAEYSLTDGGGINVVNRGFDSAKNRWKEARARAYFVQAPDIGHLRVSFFGPFYGSYVLFDIADDYTRAMVCGPDKSYLWILSRAPKLPDELLTPMLATAKNLGFSVDKLVFPPTGELSA